MTSASRRHILICFACILLAAPAVSAGPNDQSVPFTSRKVPFTLEKRADPTTEFEDPFAGSVPAGSGTRMMTWRGAAVEGDAWAQYQLGMAYLTVIGAGRDDEAALYWLRKSAMQGLPEAQITLGNIYETGKAVARDDDEAFRWYQMAAEHGHIQMQIYVGLRYAIGRGVPREVETAYMWFTIAMKLGDQGAENYLATAAGQMTPDQIVRAERLADEWMARHRR